MELKDLVKDMLADVRKQKSKPKTKAKRKVVAKDPATSPAEPVIVDPWEKSSIVLITIHTTCRSCGEISITQEPSLYLEMHTRSVRNRVRRLERIENYTGQWHEIYAKLPKRIEPIQRESEACPWCFGLEASSDGLHCSIPLPTQEEFNFNEENSDSIDASGVH